MKCFFARWHAVRFIWIGEGGPSSHLTDTKWIVDNCSIYKSSTSIEHLRTDSLSDSGTKVFAAEIPIEQLLTCDDGRIRQWAAEQAERV